ncbi:uncharacterized protein PODANS_5_9715 [Podospora anserina S mat+]|uniref:Podospora anserina S mat+ genomic DNA chromosome 5, supercontig 9 n=1 Tax=Podospora anserina (strain S / ATCC MYA-4624 / DSM 980 / FGSC 10383) TaxID=515849 RepID=B2AL24_PODAN|nr:uncharacterized protein PODANS_5_9715 [Podospora anserina S mat+]CAP64697.1 unnamed protein product [Podospora anserina S mat+]CDP30092.1 Putative protein of unknown function [Podospora anserina S mat+]
METGNWSEEGAAGGSSSAFSWLDELAEEAWLNKEAEEDVGVRGDGLVSESWPFPAVEAARPLPRLPSTAFAGQRSRRWQPRFQPTLSVVRDLSPAPPPPTPSCAPPSPPTTSVVGQAEESLDRLGPVDKGKGKAVDEEQPAGRPTFQQTVATAPTSSPSQAPPIPRLPSPLPSFVRRMLETSAPPRLADRPLHPDLLRERLPPFVHSPSPTKRASTTPMAPTERPVTPLQVAQPELKSRWSPSPPPSPTKVQKLMKAMSFASLRSQKSKTSLREQSSSSAVPPVPDLPPTTPDTTKRKSDRSSASTKKSFGSFGKSSLGRGSSSSQKSNWVAAAFGCDSSSITRPRTASGRTERSSTTERSSGSSLMSSALSRQASTITPERPQAGLSSLPLLPAASTFHPEPPSATHIVPPMPPVPQSPPHPSDLHRKISMPSMFLRKKKSSLNKKEDPQENKGEDEEGK